MVALFSSRKKKLQDELRQLQALQAEHDAHAVAATERSKVLKRRWKVAVLLVTIVGSLATAAASVYGPVLTRQENLGIAAKWKKGEALAGVGSMHPPQVGTPYDPNDPKTQGAQALGTGSLTISLTAEKDRNYTIVDIKPIIDRETPERPAWFLLPGGASSGGGGIRNIIYKLDLDSGKLTKTDDSASPQSEAGGQSALGASPSLFSPFNLSSDYAATFTIFAQASKGNYSFSIDILYQKNGESQIRDDVIGKYTVYSLDNVHPTFKVGAESKVELTQ